MSDILRTYRELISKPTFDERFKYLRMHSHIGLDKFGFDRYLNQKFYHSSEWQRIRDQVIVRDNGCDLGCEDRPINGKIYIHHMNPIEVSDLSNDISKILDLNFLICCSHKTHNAIHYGDIDTTFRDPIERKPNDTCPWKK